MPLGPFRLAPVPVARPWGGGRLGEFGIDVGPGEPIGEAWVVADLPDGVANHVDDPRSRVAGGPHDGASLHDLILRYGEALMGDVPPTSDDRFPLLVKLLDAREPLSVQVHPPADYVADHPESRLKTESWYVIDAEEGAELLLGFDDRVDDEELQTRFGRPEFVELLCSVEALPGTTHHLPAGLVHSLGAGVLVAEVQTPSDTTFRIYDWSEELGREPRPLHREEALASIRRELPERRIVPASTRPGTRTLVRTDHYRMIEHRTPGGRIERKTVDGPSILVVLAGSVSVGDLEFAAGGTALIPASEANEQVVSDGPALLLEAIPGGG